MTSADENNYKLRTIPTVNSPVMGIVNFGMGWEGGGYRSSAFNGDIGDYSIDVVKDVKGGRLFAVSYQHNMLVLSGYAFVIPFPHSDIFTFFKFGEIPFCSRMNDQGI